MNTIKENILNQSNYAQRKFKHCKIIGEDNRRRILYKYMNLESAIKCIKNKVLCFVEPTCWKDQYEKLFYTANYSKVDTCEKFPLTLFASCFTKNQTSEACWSVYVHEKARIASHCVQFRINRKFFRKELNQCMQKYHGTVYEGQCNYSLHDAQIIKLPQKESPLYSEIFENDFDLSSFLSLLLIKRECFQYENESRFFFIPENCSTLDVHSKKSSGKYVLLPLNWSTFVESIVVDEKCPDVLFQSFVEVCENAHLPKPERNKLYHAPINIPITIGE